MNTPDTNHTARRCDGEAHTDGRPSLTRKMRLASRLMRAEMRKALRAETVPTRGDVKAAARAIEDRAASALSADELTAVLTALDKIVDAFGGPDALPIRPHRHYGPRRYEQSIALRAVCPEPALGLGHGEQHGHRMHRRFSRM